MIDLGTFKEKLIEHYILIKKNFNKMKNIKFIPTILLLFIATQSLFAQVEFQIVWQNELQRYHVSMISSTTWEYPYNRTSSAQITLKAPTGEFDLTELTSLQPNVTWEANSRIDSPDEAPEFDYVSIAMTSLGTKELAYKAGESVPLFTFKSTNDCITGLELINNTNDAFMPPNSRSANVGNQITTLGARGNAYAGLKGNAVINCSQIQITTSIRHKIHPNPATEKVNLDVEWQKMPTAGQIVFHTITGEQIKSVTVHLKTGKNNFELPIQDLMHGVYFLTLKSNEVEEKLKKLVVTQK